MEGLSYFLVASVGALILFFVQKTRGAFLLSFITSLNPSWTGPGHLILDAIIFSGVGGYVAVLLTNPCTPAQALIGGFTWTSLMALLPFKVSDKKES